MPCQVSKTLTVCLSSNNLFNKPDLIISPLPISTPSPSVPLASENENA